MVGIPSYLWNSSSSSSNDNDCDDEEYQRHSVGFHYLPATASHPPLRIFYPAAAAAAASAAAVSVLPVSSSDEQQQQQRQEKILRRVGWFAKQDTNVVEYLKGYLHTIGVIQGDSWTTRWLVHPCVYLLSFVLPMTWLKLPVGVGEGARPSAASAKNNTKNKFPLIIFSHGLTGTGQENAFLLASWARQGTGAIVVGVHHTDGSSCCVPMSDGSMHYYQKGPSYANYDPEFRPRQVQKRAQQLFQARSLMCAGNDTDTDDNNMTKDESKDWLLRAIQDQVDPTRVVAAGYSYGAATVARAVVQMMEEQQQQQLPFQAAIFLDGWFHIDVQKSAGIEFRFPQEAFRYVEEEHHKWPIPSLFLNSEQFQGYPKLFQATQVLAKAAAATGGGGAAATASPVVLPKTGHQNFCDVIFWLPMRLLKKMMMGAVGEADPFAVYQEIVERTSAFLQEQVGGSVLPRASSSSSQPIASPPSSSSFSSSTSSRQKED